MRRAGPGLVQQWARTTGWDLHQGQLEALRSWLRFGIIACGRRWGKTELAAAVAEVNAFYYPGLYWIVGETFETADQTLDAAYAHLSRAPSRIVSRYSRAEHRIELVSGGIIAGKSADHPEGLLGRGLSGVVFEEAAATPERMWSQFIRPALADRRGWGLFISSPRGRGNWLYRLALDNAGVPEWSLRCSPSWENRHVFPGGREDREIANARAAYERSGLLPLWEQEFGGSFAHLQGRIYQAWDPDCHIRPLEECIVGVPEWRLAIDYGFRNPCCILVLGKRDGGYSVVDEWYAQGKTLDEVKAAARVLAARWNAWKGWDDPSEPGNREALNRDHLAISPAYNDVGPGILTVAHFLGLPDGMRIAKGRCPNLCAEAEDYIWRADTSSRENEEPIKVRDHAMDAWRYGIASWERLDEAGARGTRVEFAAARQPPLHGRVVIGARR